MSNVAHSSEEHSIIWWMFMAATMNAATFMGKKFLDNQVKRLFPSVGCARNRLLFRTEQRRGWNYRSWSLGFGYWSVAFFSVQPQKSKENVQRTCGMTHRHINTQRTKLRHNEQNNMRRRLIFLKRELFSIWCDVVHFWTMKQWSRRSSRARVQQWDTYPEPTELRL